MDKLRLNLEELAVESFEAEGSDAPQEGTVEGRELRPTRFCVTLPISDCCTPRWEAL